MFPKIPAKRPHSILRGKYAPRIGRLHPDSRALLFSRASLKKQLPKGSGKLRRKKGRGQENSRIKQDSDNIIGYS